MDPLPKSPNTRRDDLQEGYQLDGRLIRPLIFGIKNTDYRTGKLGF